MHRNIQIFETDEPCALCGRQGIPMSRHHVVPTTMHSSKLIRKSFTREQLQEVIVVCAACHEHIHRFHRPQELARELNTLVKLAKDKEIADFAKWVRKHGKE